MKAITKKHTYTNLNIIYNPSFFSVINLNRNLTTKAIIRKIKFAKVLFILFIYLME